MREKNGAVSHDLTRHQRHTQTQVPLGDSRQHGSEPKGALLRENLRRWSPRRPRGWE
jgi:hypothetical protein